MNRLFPCFLLLLGFTMRALGGEQEVTFIVPDQFHGAIVLLADREKGLEISTVTREVRIPPNGLLRVKSFDFFPQDWYTLLPRRASGTELPTYVESTEHPEQTYFRPLGGNTPRDRMYFIGTGTECAELQRSPLRAVYLRTEVLKHEFSAASPSK